VCGSNATLFGRYVVCFHFSIYTCMSFGVVSQNIWRETYKMAVHLFIKFTCENTGFEIQLTKQASLNLEKENLPLGEKDVRDFNQNKGGGGFMCGFF